MVTFCCVLLYKPSYKDSRSSVCVGKRRSGSCGLQLTRGLWAASWWSVSVCACKAHVTTETLVLAETLILAALWQPQSPGWRTTTPGWSLEMIWRTRTSVCECLNTKTLLCQCKHQPDGGVQTHSKLWLRSKVHPLNIDQIRGLKLRLQRVDICKVTNATS